MQNEKYLVFKRIIRECNYDNTYKLAWAKALVELSGEIEIVEDSITIPLEQIAEKFLKYYWNQTIFFDLIQGSNPNKPPEVVSHVKKLIEQFYKKVDNRKPIRYERLIGIVGTLSIEKELTKTIYDIERTLKKDVSWRFLNVPGTTINIYEYKKGDAELKIDAPLLQLFKENEQDLYDLINYRWGMILETFNNSPRISKKVKIIDEQEIKRNSLAKYRQYLDLENTEHICFICGEPIPEKEISIDHVIPWGYMYSDDIWNLVYVHKRCNSQKGIIIPEKEKIEHLKKRNDRLLNYMEKKKLFDKQYEELSMAKEHDYVEKFWVGCKS